MKILAIDPGESGSAALYEGLQLVRVMSFLHTPEYWKELYWWCLVYHPDLCAKENVHAFSGQGISSTASFMWHDGMVYSVVSITTPIKKVEPQWWQRRIGLPHHYDIPEKGKRRAANRKDQKAFALSRFPEILAEYDKPAALPPEVAEKCGKKSTTPDVWGSVCIGYAAALEAAGVPPGQLA